MAEEILNRVAQSKLRTFDLEDYYPEGERVKFDIKDWLHEGYILKEKEFRTFVAAHDWKKYQDKYIAIYCSTNAIIPGWANMLISSKLTPYAKKIVIGDLEQLETSLYQEIVSELDISPYIDQFVIIKGCTNKPVPPNAYVWLISKMQTVAKQVMYGEACSSVPLFKKKK